MKIVLLSDIHANFEALKIHQDTLESADKILCLGDLVGYYCQVNEVIDYIRKFKPACVLGNHDKFLIDNKTDDAPESVKFGIQYARENISSDNYKWLCSLPICLGQVFDGISIFMCHGSPWSPIDDYLYENNPKINRLNEFDYNIVAFGQTHRKWILRKNDKTLFINPGSIGQSRDECCVSSLAVIDTINMKTDIITKKYNPAKIIELAKKNGAKDWIYKHLKD